MSANRNTDTRERLLLIAPNKGAIALIVRAISGQLRLHNLISGQSPALPPARSLFFHVCTSPCTTCSSVPQLAERAGLRGGKDKKNIWIAAQIVFPFFPLKLHFFGAALCRCTSSVIRSGRQRDACPKCIGADISRRLLCLFPVSALLAGRCAGRAAKGRCLFERTFRPLGGGHDTSACK